MASLRKRGRVWYYRFTDGDGVAHERKGCPDRRETEAMAAAAEADAGKVRSGLIDPKALGFRAQEARPLADHLADWRRDMQARGKTPKHAEQFYDRAGKLVALVRGARLADLEPGLRKAAQEPAARALADRLTAARLSELAPDRIQSALAALRDAGKANQTVNHYRAALRAFVRWLWDKGRLNDNPMRGVKGFNVEEDPRGVPPGRLPTRPLPSCQRDEEPPPGRTADPAGPGPRPGRVAARQAPRGVRLAPSP